MPMLQINTEALNGMTDEQFVRFCVTNRDLCIERDKNKNIIIMSPAFTFTGWWNAEIVSILRNWNEKTKTGYVFDSSTGFTLPNSAMRSPDASWIAKERWEKLSQEEKESFAPICPDFVIELRSKSDSLKTIQHKMEEWIENGCRLGWLIDMENRAAYIYKPGREPLKQSFNKTLKGNDILQGFELDLSVNR